MTGRVRALLRAASEPVTRGAPAAEPSIVYLDSVLDDVPSAWIPRVRYEIRDGKLEARVRLFRDNRAVSDQRIIAEPEAAQAARSIASAIVAAAARLNLQ